MPVGTSFFVNLLRVELSPQFICADIRVSLTADALLLDGVVDGSVGGAPSEGVDVASSSFPSMKIQGLIELVGL